jgi:large subunit ribosomal protein L13
MGHDRQIPFATMLAKHPERIIEKAVYGMLPKSSLAKQSIRMKLRVYAGDSTRTRPSSPPRSPSAAGGE